MPNESTIALIEIVLCMNIWVCIAIEHYLAKYIHSLGWIVEHDEVNMQITHIRDNSNNEMTNKWQKILRGIARLRTVFVILAVVFLGVGLGSY